MTKKRGSLINLKEKIKSISPLIKGKSPYLGLGSASASRNSSKLPTESSMTHHDEPYPLGNGNLFDQLRHQSLVDEL